MPSTPSLRDLQVTLKSSKRSMRKYMATIARKTNMSNGMVTHYFNGFGTSEEKYQQIIKVVADINEELDIKQDQLEAAARIADEKKALPTERKNRQYTKRQTF